MEIIEYKEDRHCNNKQDTRSKERYERKQALKSFKKLKQQLVDQHLEKLNVEAVTQETTNILKIPHDSINNCCLKANENASLITKIVKKRGEKMNCSETLSRLQNLGAFEYKGYSVADSNDLVHSSSKKMKLKEEYFTLTNKKQPKCCKKCKTLFYSEVAPRLCRRGSCIMGGGQNFWEMEERIAHWLEHKDAKLAQIYSKDNINGIVQLDEKRIADFFRHLKIFYSDTI